MSTPPPPGLLVVGNEEFLRARATTAYLTALRGTQGELTLHAAAAEPLTPHEVDQLLSPDLMGGLPVLLISDGNRLSKETLAHVCAYIPDPDSALIIDIPKPTDAGGKAVTTALAAAGIHTETITPPKPGKALRDYVKTELRRVGLRADYDTETALMDAEKDLRGITIRIEQLADDHDTGPGAPPLTVDHVHAVATSATVTGFVVADAFLSRNPRAVAAAVQAAKDAGAADLLIQASCLNGLRDIAHLTTGATGKMPPWKAQKLRGTAARWNPATLARALHEMGVIGETVRSSTRTHNDLAAALQRAIA